VERYKKAFAPGGVRQFYTGQRVLDSGRYESLVRMSAARGAAAASAFFPAYRERPRRTDEGIGEAGQDER
jgi:hypothetical protein